MLLERGKLETPNKNSRSKARNQQRTQPTNYTGWIWDLSNVLMSHCLVKFTWDKKHPGDNLARICLLQNLKTSDF